MTENDGPNERTLRIPLARAVAGAAATLALPGLIADARAADAGTRDVTCSSTETGYSTCASYEPDGSGNWLVSYATATAPADFCSVNGASYKAAAQAIPPGGTAGTKQWSLISTGTCENELQFPQLLGSYAPATSFCTSWYKNGSPIANTASCVALP